MLMICGSEARTTAQRPIAVPAARLSVAGSTLLSCLVMVLEVFERVGGIEVLAGAGNSAGAKAPALRPPHTYF